MGRQALYQKYRSQSFAEVVGQPYVVRSITNAIKTGQVGHAYLFCGPRGTGKTTMARLLARAVNCENQEEAPCGRCESCRMALAGSHPDIIEINAANETHVEDIRDLIERARLAPMIGRYKVYIIDEVHQLSSSAASALLKTLEEPPAHVIFILATTDPQKLLPTIISRCQRFDFTRISQQEIQAHLLDVARQENFTLDEEAAEEIAELADGGMRDALSILDQVLAYGGGQVHLGDVNAMFGLASAGEKMALLKDICTGNVEDLLARTSDAEAHGTDLKRLTGDLIRILKDAVIYAATRKDKLLQHARVQDCQELNALCSQEQMMAMIDGFLAAQNQYRQTRSVRDVFEIACLGMMKPADVSASEKPAEEHAGMETESPAAETAAPAEQPEEETPSESPQEHAGMNDDAEKQEPLPETAMPDTETVLAIMTAASKPSKAADQEALGQILSSSGMDRYKAALKQAEIGASGPDAVLLVVRSEAMACHIAEPDFNRGLYFYLKEKGMDKMPYALSPERFSQDVTAFKKRFAAGTLPPAIQVTRYAENKEEDPEARSLQKLVDTFGAENVEVVEDDAS
jgi:DNA polymerase-3 subunit gamma/tau